MHANTLRSLMPAVAIALLLTACGSSTTGSAELKSPQDVIDAIAKANLPCRASGDPTIDTNSESKGYNLIACDDFAVILITDKAKFDATDKGNCTRLDTTFLAQAGKQEIVIGPTFRIASVAQDGTFTPSATAAALAKALGGEATTLGDYYSKICALPNPSPTASAG